MNDEEKQSVANAGKLILSDLIFILLPIFVAVIIDFSRNKTFDIFSSKDIGLINMVLWGQGLTKTIAGLVKTRVNKKLAFIVLYVSLVFSLGLVPATILYTIHHLQGNLACHLIWIQNAHTCVGIALYFFFGRFAQTLLDESQ